MLPVSSLLFCRVSTNLKKALDMDGKKCYFYARQQKTAAPESGNFRKPALLIRTLRVTVKIFYIVLTVVARGFGCGRGKKISGADWVFNLIRAFFVVIS